MKFVHDRLDDVRMIADMIGDVSELFGGRYGRYGRA